VTGAVRLHALIAFAVLAPTTASAQTPTVDGVRAFTHGDYATAARILRPVAEDTAQPDPIAVFFMAALYDSGQGVARNPVRACGLYLRAATSANPLMIQALALARAIHQDNPRLREMCEAISAGTWRDSPSASFTLDPDHWVRIDHGNFTIGFRGTESTVMTLGGFGWVFLPFRYTPAVVSRPRPLRRHFIESFAWIPSSVSSEPPWTLTWFIFEIIDNNLWPVTPGPIVSAAQPDPRFPVNEITQLRVNSDGDAEWVVAGTNSRRGVIPLRPPQ
jgi:hypothetical protein